MFEKFKSFGTSFLVLLGLSEYEKTEDGKSTLTAENKTQLIKYGFSDEFIADFNSALEKDFKDDVSTGNERSESMAAMKATVAQLALQLSTVYSEKESLVKEKGELSQEVLDKQAMITDLEAKIDILANDTETDPGKGSQHGQSKEFDMKINLKDEKQLCGFAGSRFALDRPYNMRAKAAMLYQQEGLSLAVAESSSIDYQRLKDDLGDFYRVRWQDRLQSFLMLLPSLEKIFPCEYGFQDRAVLVNLWLGEFSQADNTQSDFDDVVKGDYDFDPEELRMFDVMFSHKFKNLKELEKTWIGYLNEEGSQVMKWSFIEFILVETAKKLHNEREQRRINGRRKNPDLGKPGLAMEAADGLYEFTRKKVDGWDHEGKTVYQIKPFILGIITPGNIGDVLYKGTSQIPAVVRDSGNLVCFLPAILKTWYDKWQETNFGTNTDYTGAKSFIKEYPTVRIEVIPNAENHNRIIWTLSGNIKNFAHVKGEMTRFSIEQQDWTLKVWSNWKESIWARMVGFRYTKKEDMDGSRQMIWCNEYDLSPDYFLPAQKDDATPSVHIHTSIMTVANTDELQITDFKNAEVGRKIRIQNGSVNKGIKILKTGVFSLLTADWIPGKGEILNLMKRADGKFIELSRETAATGALVFADDVTTPSLTGAINFVTGVNTQATEITNFEDADNDTVYTIFGNGTTNASTIANGGNFSLTEAMILKEGTFIKLVKAGNTFFEIARG